MFCSRVYFGSNIMVDVVVEKRLDFITRISNKRKWTFGDNNPYFEEVFTHMPRIKAVNLNEYKRKLKERKKNEKDRILSYFD